MNVIKKIYELNKERGWNDYTLALKSGLSSSTIANMKRRQTIPSVATLEQICAAYGITLSQFFNDEEQVMPVNEEQSRIISKWVKLSDSQKQLFEGIMDELIQEPGKDKNNQIQE